MPGLNPKNTDTQPEISLLSEQREEEVSKRIDFRNVNSLWSSAAVETLFRLGLRTAIVCPGSRSTPLTMAFARHYKIATIPVLDERSASFFALGCAKQQFRPTAIVCTSGTAGANFYPAIIEAYESGIPLIVFTADRPPEMRDCGSGQTIDQQKLFGRFVKHYSELAVPETTLPMLDYLKQTLVNGWGRATTPKAGPIHFNCPFRDPLPPIADGTTEALSAVFHPTSFFDSIAPPTTAIIQTKSVPTDAWTQFRRGLIIAGASIPSDPERYCEALKEISLILGWPILAEGLSPLRNYAYSNNRLISTYDIILRNAQRADSLIPNTILQLGPLPISKVLRQWLQHHKPQHWAVSEGENLDPLHGATQFLFSNVNQIATALKDSHATKLENKSDNESNNEYVQQWLASEQLVRRTLDNRLETEQTLLESKVVWLLSQHLPKGTPLFIANSMPVRDVEYFWPIGDRHIQPLFSRGANGIDGTLSTAMGAAHNNRPTVLLTGDLAFLHDTNGLLNAAQIDGHLTIVVINNQGGGIFEMLPIAQFKPEFEKYFVTPQSVEIASLCQAYSIEHKIISEINNFVACIASLPTQGMRVLEVMCDRQQSVLQRKALLNVI